MRVLMVHNRYRIRGGEDESTQSEIATLRAHGNEVLEYLKDNREEPQLGGATSGLRCIWSRNDYSALRQRIREFKPDVLHVQNFFPLVSPAAYYAAAAENVPVVQSLRNYRLVCPSATMLRNGMPCDSCPRLGLPIPGLIHGCYRGSRRATAAVAAMATIHQILGTWSRKVAAYIVLSKYMRSVFVRAGFDSQKLSVKPNFVVSDPGVGRGMGDYFLYAGRLSEEKGIRSLISEWRLFQPRFGLHIIGDGPLRPEIEQLAACDPRVHYLGIASPQDVLSYMGSAAAVLVPSVWHEPFGRTVVEAFARGTPVIASCMGGLPEIVHHGKTGYVYGDIPGRTLASVMSDFVNLPELRVAMGRNARAEYETKYTADVNYGQLMSIYKSITAAEIRDESLPSFA